MELADSYCDFPVKSRNAMERAGGVARLLGGEREMLGCSGCSEGPLCSANEAGGERAGELPRELCNFSSPRERMLSHARPIVLLLCK